VLKIKLSIPGLGSNINISQFVGNLENRYQNCQFYINNSNISEVDFWFVIDDLQFQKESVMVDPDHIFFLTAEQVHNIGYYNSSNKSKFLDQFSKIVSCYDIFRENAEYDIPFLGWMINANHGPSIMAETNRDVNWLKNLTNLEKTRTISVFCSAKTLTPEHQARYKFVEILKKHFGDTLDWYGNGVQSIPEKWDGIAPYKYHIALENQSRHNIISEKIYDSYLGLAYPIYWGAPNLADYFPKESFSQIEILDWRNSIKTIERLLLKDDWNQKLPALIESKNKVLMDYNPFQRITKLANDNRRQQPALKERVVLYSTQAMHKKSKGGCVKQLIYKSGRIFQSVGNELIKISG
jgi:hypothetical protein